MRRKFKLPSSLNNYTLLHNERDLFTKSLNKICIALSAIYVLTYALFKIYSVSLIALGIFSIFLIGQVVISKRNFNLFKIISLANISLATLIFTQLLGKESNLHFIFVVNIIFPLIVFTHVQKKSVKVFIAVNILLFGLSNFDFPYINHSLIPQEHIKFVSIITPWTFLILLLIPVQKLYKISINLIQTVIDDKVELEKITEDIFTQKDLLQGVINSSKYNSIFAVDADFNLINFNTAFKAWMRQTQKANVSIGGNYFDYLPKPKALLYKPLFRRALSGTTFSKKVINKIQGEEIHIEMTFTPLLHNDEVLGVTVFSRDVTDTIKLEYTIQEKRVTEKSLQFRTDFLAQMSHEIRTPLNGIVGMADLISDSDNLSEKEKDQLTIITESGNELMHIINSVLDLSKLEAGQVKVSPSVRPSSKLLDHTKDLFQNRAESKGIELKTSLGKDLPEGVNIDAIRIHQILNNLTSNAIKFTNSGSVEIKVSGENQTADSIDLRFEITDTGSGISERDQKRLFDKYSQISTNMARKADGAQMGTGLGLTICQELVQLMNGEIGVTSEIGKGSTFYFKIPKIEIKELNQGKGQIKNNLEFDSLSKHILVVEDKKVNQKVAQLVLKSIGCTSEIAENGEEAIMIYMKNQDKFDLILMDLQMPIMDGLTATAELKRNFENVPPIIALSANNMEGDSDYYLKHGLDGYLSKPINGKILKETLSQYLRS